MELAQTHTLGADNGHNKSQRGDSVLLEVAGLWECADYRPWGRIVRVRTTQDGCPDLCHLMISCSCDTHPVFFSFEVFLLCFESSLGNTVKTSLIRLQCTFCNWYNSQTPEFHFKRAAHKLQLLRLNFIPANLNGSSMLIWCSRNISKALMCPFS